MRTRNNAISEPVDACFKGAGHIVVSTTSDGPAHQFKKDMTKGVTGNVRVAMGNSILSRTLCLCKIDWGTAADVPMHYLDFWMVYEKIAACSFVGGGVRNVIARDTKYPSA